MSKNIVTIVGARPQFIKASVVSRAIRSNSGLDEFIVHTGQHFDPNMSDVFFGELDIPRPAVQLSISGGNHGAMTGRMLLEIEKVLIDYKPDAVLVYGDTNSTLAGALAAAKLHIPVAHVEAGLRSHNMRMPEEINRILTDQISTLLFCPSSTSVNNLKAEGLMNRVAYCGNVGDVMCDSTIYFSQFARQPVDFTVIGSFALATLHRAENTDDAERLTEIVKGINAVHNQLAPVVLPIHPRTRKKLTELGLALECHVIDPVGYLEMLWLIQNSAFIVTDSGGLQKEAYFLSKPCIVTRDETEWVELVEAGINCLVGASAAQLTEASEAAFHREFDAKSGIYGNGSSSKEIAKRLREFLYA